VRQDAVNSGDADWHPEIWGWSNGIHPFYARMAASLPDGCRVVELGAYYGRSLLYLLTKLHEREKRASLVGVDPGHFPGAYEGLLQNVRDVQDELERAHPLAQSIAIWRETGRDVLHIVADQSLDMVFIDADHSEAAVREDIEGWLPKVKPGGIIAGHDYGQPDIPGVALAVDALLPEREIHEGTVWSYRVELRT
jgi:predicted O-methyltransferase YrrM